MPFPRRPLFLRTWDALIGRRTAAAPPKRTPPRLELIPLEDRFVLTRPLPLPFLFTGVGTGLPPLARAYDAETGELKFEKQPFAPGFSGGVRVGAGDLDHDGMPDLIAAAGPGGGPRVVVYSGRTGHQLAGPLGSFYAYAAGFTGGVSVASGDVDGDEHADLITAAGAGGAPHVKVWSGKTGQLIQSFYAFAPAFRGGATVAAADFTGDGRADLVVGAGPGGGPHVKVFDLSTGQPVNPPLGSFYAFDKAFTGGVDVGTDYLAGDVTGDGRADIAAGRGRGAGSLVRVFDGVSGNVALEFSPFGSGMTAGVRTATAFVDDDEYADVIAATGAGPTATVKVFSGLTGTELASPMSPYTPFGSAFTGGLFVAASNDPPINQPFVTAVRHASETDPTGAGRGVFEVARHGGTGTFVVGYQITGGTAAVGTDFSAPSSSGTVTLVGGAVTLYVVPFDDGDAEAAETVEVTLLPGAGYTLGSPTVATLTLYDNDSGGGGGPPPPPPSRPVVVGVSDDTGLSAADGLTADNTLDVFGTADAGVAVAVTAVNVATGASASAGTVTASGAGTWTLTYATALADGPYRFTAVAAVGTLTSAPAIPYPVRVDTAAPAVTAAFDPWDAPTSLRPTLRVTAADLNGLGTTAVLDVDLNNDSDYADAGETAADSGSLANGTAAFAAYPLLAVGGAARFRVRLLDAAGNEGTSPVVTRTPPAVTTAWAVADETDQRSGGAGGILKTGRATADLPLHLGLAPSDCGCQGDALHYDSGTANPSPLESFALQSDNGALGLPDQVTVTFAWDGIPNSTTLLLPTDMTPGEVWRFGIGPPAFPFLSRETGRHTYSFDVFIDYEGATTTHDVHRSLTGTTYVVNRSDSPFGAGWTFANVDALYTVAADAWGPAGVLRAKGKGGWAFYEELSGGGYLSPSGDAGGLATAAGGWVYTAADGKTRTFDADGRMTGWAERAGHERFTYTYDGSGRLTGMAAPDGSLGTFAYTGPGVVATGTGGRTTTLTLDGGGDLVGAATADGGLATFTYSDHRLTDDTRGLLAAEWDGSAVVSSFGAGPDEWTLVAADAAGWWDGARLGRLTDGNGDTTGAVFERHGQPTYLLAANGGVTTILRDGNGRETGRTDPLGGTTTTARSALGNPTAVTRPNGGTFTFTRSGTHDDLVGWRDETGNRGTATYDGVGQVQTVTDPLGGVTTYAWTATGQIESVTDPTGRTTTYVYDAGRRLLRTISGGISSGTMLYDAAGASVGWIDALGFTTTILNDGVGRPVAVTTPDGATAITVYDPGSGLVVGTISPSGVRTSYLYDGAGRRTVVIEGVGSGIEARTTSVYDAAGRLIAEVAPTGLATEYEYDGDGNVVAVTDAAGHTTRTFYDLTGRPVGTADPMWRLTATAYDGNGNAVADMDRVGAVTTRTFDAADRVVAVTDPRGYTTTTVYDAKGQTIAVIDALGNRSTTVYDAAGRTLARIDPLGRAVSTAYDARGFAEVVIDALGNRTTTVYDARGSVVATVDALGNRSTTVFDGAGHAVATVDPLGNRSTSVFDSYGRFVASVDPLGNRTSAVYDARDRRVATLDALGNLATTVLDVAGRTVATLDALGHATTTVYDPFGRAVATVDPRGNRTTTLYDDRLPGEELDAGFRHFSDVTAAVDAAGVWTSWATDPVGRLYRSVDAREYATTTVYDGNSNVVAVIDALGNRTTTVYDALNRPVATVDPLGNRSTSVFDAAGQMVASVDALGNRSTTVYDLAGRAVAFVDALGRTSTAVYDALGRTVAGVDALGNRSTSVFDAAGRVIESVDARGNTTTGVYDAAGNRVAVIDALGNRSTTVYDALNRPVASIDPLGNRTTSIYDARGAVIATQDALGRLWTTTYDAAGNAVASTDPLGRTSTAVYDALNRVVATVDPLGNTSATVFDVAGNAVASVDPLDRRTTAVYDALNRPVARIDALGNRGTTVYDAAGNAVAVIDPLGNRSTTVFDATNRAIASVDALGNRSTAVFDAAGQMVASVDPLGNRTTSIYDAAGRKVATQDALGHLWTSVYDAAGNAVASVDPLGRTNTTVYDALNRAVASIDALGNRSTSVFDAAGNAVAGIDALGNRTTSVYDQLNRAVARIDALGNRGTFVFDAAGQAVASIDALGRVSTTVYDAAGRPVARVDALGHVATTVYDEAGNAVAAVNPLGHVTAVAFDALNRPVAVTDALGNRSTSVYDAAGNLIASIDPLGNRSTTVYDATNRAVSVRDATNGVTTFGYDSRGNRVTVTDPVGNTTTSAFDALNRVVAETDPQGVTATAAYDATGKMVSATDRLGRRREFAFDDADRQTTETWYAVGGTLAQTQTFTYDAVGNRLTAADPDGTYTLAYDALHRVLVAQEPFGQTLTNAYDAVGNRTSVQDSQGGTTTGTFDARNQLTARQTGGSGVTPIKETRGYTAAGELATVTRYSWSGSAWTAIGTGTFAYDEAGRLTGIRHADGSNATLASYAYSFDAASRLTGVVTNGAVQTFGYDATSQVTDDNGAAYTYDANGNRTNTGYATGTGNRTTNDGTWTYTYDAAGNVSKRSKGASAETWVYGYDHGNRMLTAVRSATDGGTATARVTYAYDAFDNRIERQAWDGTTTTTERFAFDGWDTTKPDPVGGENFDAWADLDGGNALVTRRVFGTGFDELVARQTAGGTVTWYATDHQGSVRLLLDNSGAITGTLVYDAFGKELNASGAVDRYRYTGREWDGPLGLQYSRNRIYDPASGKWLSVDPKGFDAGDVNLYRYVGNRATTARDPSGMFLFARWQHRQPWLDWFKQIGLEVEWIPDESESYVFSKARGYFLVKNPEQLTALRLASNDARETRLFQALASNSIDQKSVLNIMAEPTSEDKYNHTPAGEYYYEKQSTLRYYLNHKMKFLQERAACAANARPLGFTDPGNVELNAIFAKGPLTNYSAGTIHGDSVETALHESGQLIHGMFVGIGEETALQLIEGFALGKAVEFGAYLSKQGFKVAKDGYGRVSGVFKSGRSASSAELKAAASDFQNLLKAEGVPGPGKWVRPRRAHEVQETRDLVASIRKENGYPTTGSDKWKWPTHTPRNGIEFPAPLRQDQLIGLSEQFCSEFAQVTMKDGTVRLFKGPASGTIKVKDPRTGKLVASGGNEVEIEMAEGAKRNIVRIDHTHPTNSTTNWLSSQADRDLLTQYRKRFNPDIVMSIITRDKEKEIWSFLVTP